MQTFFIIEKTKKYRKCPALATCLSRYAQPAHTSFAMSISHLAMIQLCNLANECHFAQIAVQALAAAVSHGAHQMAQLSLLNTLKI